MRCFDCGTDFETATDACPNCGRLPETDPDRYFKAAMESVASGDLKGSIALLQDCLELNPDHLSGRYNLGVALSLEDRCDEAIDHLSVVASQDPDYPGIYTAMGQAAFGSYLFHEEQANLRSAMMIHLLRQAVDRDSQDVNAYFSLGNAYIALGMAKEALPCLKYALSLDPHSSATCFTMAKAFKMLGKCRQAALMAQKALDLSDASDQFREDMQSLLADLRQGVPPL